MKKTTGTHNNIDNSLRRKKEQARRIRRQKRRKRTVVVLVSLVTITMLGLILVPFSTTPNTNNTPEVIVEESPSIQEESFQPKKVDPLLQAYMANSDSFKDEYKRISYMDYVLLVKAVQNEVGYNEDYFPHYNFDMIQQIMTVSILNRIGKPGFADSLVSVLEQPGQYPGLLESINSPENQDIYNVLDKRTNRNVLRVLRGDVEYPSDIYWEMSFTETQVPEESIDIMKFQGTGAQTYCFYSALTADGRLLVMAGNPNGPY